jgi:hypothetical protein
MSDGCGRLDYCWSGHVDGMMLTNFVAARFIADRIWALFIADHLSIGRAIAPAGSLYRGPRRGALYRGPARLAD